MVEGRIAGVGVAKALGHGEASEHSGRLEEFKRRLADLRGGEVGQKICQGISCCTVNEWGV